MPPAVVETRAKALLRARQAERLFPGFLEAAPDAVALANAAGEIVQVNARTEELFGYRRDELLGRAVEVLIPERFRARHAEHYRSYFAAPRPRRMGSGIQLVGLRKNGAEFPIDVALSPLPTEAGFLVAAAIRDMTEYRRLEAELRRRTRDLEEADHRKDQFLTTLAHELRAPLAALSQVGQLLRLPAADDRREWAAGVVERQTGHMLRLVEDLLDVARVRRGKVTLRKEPTDLAGVAARAVEISWPLIEGRKHALQVTLPPRPVWVEGDGTRLTQVVANLLTNSAKYTPEGGRIGLTLATEGGDAVLRVHDNGIGIPADMLTGVFDLFTQVHGAGGAAAGGLGIGLALVRRLVDMHRGTVAAESGGPGLGSAFIVRIPLLPYTKSAEPRAAPGRRGRTATVARGVRQMRTVGTTIAALAASVLSAHAQDPPRLSPFDSVDLRTITAVLTVFKASRDSVWPGYDLSLQPLLVYRPGRWAVVLNPPGKIEGYRPYPESWPHLGAPALLHQGATPALVGQLEFDFPVGPTAMVAVPLADDLPAQALARPRSLFAFVVHEAFHQFQRTAFGEVDEPSEEQYPILDTANSARAALEIHILEDAVRAVERRDLAGSRRLTGLFLAQRRFRWEHASPLVREFERAKELSEGTAKYVETRLVANVAILCRTGRFTDPYVCPSFRSVTVPGYLQADFESRLTDGALSPADVPRNRIYPTGAAMGVLLDFFGVEWKHKAANLPDSSALADLLALSVPVPASRLESLRKEAERRYNLPQLQRRTRTLADGYVREADDAIRAFEAQPGYRVEVQLSATGTSRSRSSTAKRWVVDNGRRVFGSEFLAYTLRRPDQQVFLTVERRAVLDDLVPQGERRVAFFVPSLDSIRVNGVPRVVTSASDYRFEGLSIQGAGFSLDVRVPGTLSLSAGRVAVRLSPRGP